MQDRGRIAGGQLRFLTNFVHTLNTTEMSRLFTMQWKARSVDKWLHAKDGTAQGDAKTEDEAREDVEAARGEERVARFHAEAEGRVFSDKRKREAQEAADFLHKQRVAMKELEANGAGLPSKLPASGPGESGVREADLKGVEGVEGVEVAEGVVGVEGAAAKVAAAVGPGPRQSGARPSANDRAQADRAWKKLLAHDQVPLPEMARMPYEVLRGQAIPYRSRVQSEPDCSSPQYLLP